VKNVIVIGSGFAGLSAACHLAKAGARVTVLDKNPTPGGRGHTFSAEGFTYDAGPSVADYYTLTRLDPSYRVFWEDGPADIPASQHALLSLFEKLEPGAGMRLDAFLKEAAYKYREGIGKLVYQPGLSPLEFVRTDVLSALFRIQLLQSVRKHVRRFFSNPKLLQLVEFPILFLGALPENTPALYTLMNYADMVGGTWYPAGGMGRVAEAMHALAVELGVEFRFDTAVREIVCEGREAIGVRTNDALHPADAVVAACDYHHAEQQLLPAAHRTYSEKYWDSRSLAPSCLLYYVGVRGRVEGLQHHNLFFDAPFEKHARQLYADNPSWPDEPLLYVCCPSKTDSSVAPPGDENLFILIPVAPGLEDTEAIREKYFSLALERIQQRTGNQFTERIVYKKSYAYQDFVQDYNSYKGNAYGLANTLRQTAFLKPSLQSSKVRNLVYAGQLTVPGPGVPPSLISGELAAAQLRKIFHLKPQPATL
jgi:phytoene desaturase